MRWWLSQTAVNNMLRLTSMLIFLDSFCPPKPWEEALIYAFPISRDHLSAMCHMKMLSKDQRTESPIENAKAFRSNKLRFFFYVDSLWHHVIHGPVEFFPSPSSKLHERHALRQNAWSPMFEVRRMWWCGEVPTYVLGTLDTDSLRSQLGKHKSMRPLHHPVIQ